MTRIVQSGRHSYATTCSNLPPTAALPPRLFSAVSNRISHSSTRRISPIPITRRNQALHVVSATDFHQKRLSASESEQTNDAGPLAGLKNTGALIVRMAERDDELEAASWLRARSFYAYPEERKFAGEVRTTTFSL